MTTSDGGSPTVFSCSFERRDEWAVILLSGEVDGDSCSRVRPLVEDLVEGQGLLDVEIDLGAVTFLDSQGLRLLAQTHLDLCEKGGHLTVVDVPPHVRRLLEITGLDAHLDVRPSERGEEASA